MACRFPHVAVPSTVLVLFSSILGYLAFLGPRGSANGASRMAMSVSGMYGWFTALLGSLSRGGAVWVRYPYVDFTSNNESTSDKTKHY